MILTISNDKPSFNLEVDAGGELEVAGERGEEFDVVGGGGVGVVVDASVELGEGGIVDDDTDVSERITMLSTPIADSSAAIFLSPGDGDEVLKDLPAVLGV